MQIQEFNSELAKILGIKGEIKIASVVRQVTTGQFVVDIRIIPTPPQVKKLRELIMRNGD